MLERLYYEIKPLVCITAAAIGLNSQMAGEVTQLMGVFLLSSGLVITFLRLRHRGYIN